MDEEVQNVTEEVTENTEVQTVEENATVDEELTDTSITAEEEEENEKKGRFVTDDEINQIVDARVKRKMRKYEREMAIYKDTENVLKTGLSVSDINEANEKLREYYTENGYKMPGKTSVFSDRDLEILAQADAEEIIAEGYESMLDEANLLAKTGYNNLNAKEQKIFLRLCEALEEKKDAQELKKLGVTDEFLKDEDFISFRKKFDKKTPVDEIYEIYKKSQPKPKIELPGSMKNNSVKTEKEYYTPEEVNALTPEEWQKPGVWEKVLNSRKKWQE